MSSFLTSGFKNMTSVFRKKHKYTNPTQIENMEEEEIIAIDPATVDRTIDKNTSEIRKLTPRKRELLTNLLSVKRVEKGLTPRERGLTSDVRREKFLETRKKLIRGNNAEVDALIKQTADEMAPEIAASDKAELLENYKATTDWQRAKRLGIKDADVFKPKRFLSPEETKLAKLIDELNKKGGIKHTRKGMRRKSRKSTRRRHGGKSRNSKRRFARKSRK